MIAWRQGKKGQMTIMIILGLLLLIVIGIFFGLSRVSFNKQASEQAGQTLTRNAEFEPIREYIQSCVATVSREGLSLLGEQGGVLYRSQGGPVLDYREEQRGTLFLELDNSRVAYGIHPPRFPAPPHAPEPPAYPYETFPYRMWPDMTPSEDGIFGLNTLPPLRRSEGPLSFESQLEQYLSSNLPTCLDLRAFEEDGFVFDLGAPEPSITFTDSGVSFDVGYDVQATLSSTGEGLRLERFHAEHPVRLSTMHRFMNSLISEEVTNISLDPSKFSSSGSPLAVSLLRDVWEQDDVIRVHDGDSRLAGRPYVFRFARHNRAPALHYLSPDHLELDNGQEVNTSILLPPYLGDYQAYDPDEDALSFSFIVQNRIGTPPLPLNLDAGELMIKVAVSDGELEDHQTLTVSNRGSSALPYCPIEQRGCYDEDMDFQGQGSFAADEAFSYAPEQFCTESEGCQCEAEQLFDPAALQRDGDNSSEACGCFDASDWADTGACCGDDADDCGLPGGEGLCYMNLAGTFSEWRDPASYDADIHYLECNDEEYLSDGSQWLDCPAGTSDIRTINNHDFLCRGTSGKDQWAECCGDDGCYSKTSGLGLSWSTGPSGDDYGKNVIDAFDGTRFRCGKDETFVQI